MKTIVYPPGFLLTSSIILSPVTFQSVTDGFTETALAKAIPNFINFQFNGLFSDTSFMTPLKMWPG